MARLSTDDRTSLLAAWQEEQSRAGKAINLTKPELRAMLDAVDDGIDDVMVTINGLFPAKMRNALSMEEKLAILFELFRRRLKVARSG